VKERILVWKIHDTANRNYQDVRLEFPVFLQERVVPVRNKRGRGRLLQRHEPNHGSRPSAPPLMLGERKTQMYINYRSALRGRETRAQRETRHPLQASPGSAHQKRYPVAIPMMSPVAV
jgi:hypothetical protein